MEDKENFESIFKVFWQSPLVQEIKSLGDSLKPKLEEHKEMVILGVLLCIIITPVMFVRSLNKKYIDKDVGYEITAPRHWKMAFAKDRKSVKFFKYKSKRYGNSTIKVAYEIGNSYGETALDYIVNGLTPQFIYTYEKMQGGSVDLREQPYLIERRGREWATTSFYIDHRDLQVLFVTMIKDYVLIITLNSVATGQAQDEKVLSKILNSLAILKIPERE